MKEELASQKPHVLIVPYPAQGHINPLIAFAKFLASKDVQITIITTPRVTKSTILPRKSSNITIETISDGSENLKEPEGIEEYFRRFRDVFSRNLAMFIDDEHEICSSAKTIIYDSSMPWVLDIAHTRGLFGASFFTQSCAVCAVYYYMKEGLIKFPYEDEVLVSLPSLPELELKDLPAFVFNDPKHLVVKLLTEQFSNIDDVDWIFFNTFDKLEIEVLDWMARKWPIKTIGPTFSLPPTTEEKLSNNKNHMINLFETNHETYTEWLNSKKTASVVYVSFGSIASLSKEQMEELAFGLMISDCSFLWVVRASEEEKLPENFATLASGKGNLIVNWCHQPQVLGHRAIGCFMSHCGWNSTLEALSFGVPIIAMARWVDQQTNAKFIEDVWRVGERVKAGDDGMISREEIRSCIEEVIRGEKGKELRRSACRWKDFASEAVEKGGTSAQNVDDFISKLQFN